MELRNVVIRGGALIVLGVAWWWLHTAPPHWYVVVRSEIQNRSPRYDAGAAVAGAVMLGIFLAACVWGMLSSRRSGGPDAAMGRGCVMFMAIGLAGLALLLAVGWFFHVSYIIWTIAVIAVLAGVQMGIALIYEGIKSMRARRARRGGASAK